MILFIMSWVISLHLSQEMQIRQQASRAFLQLRRQMLQLLIKNASEYFAESVKDYILNNASLKSSRPQTYAAVQNALNQITDAQIAKIQKIYGAFWN